MYPLAEFLFRKLRDYISEFGLLCTIINSTENFPNIWSWATVYNHVYFISVHNVCIHSFFSLQFVYMSRFRAWCRVEHKELVDYIFHGLKLSNEEKWKLLHIFATACLDFTHNINSYNENKCFILKCKPPTN